MAHKKDVPLVEVHRGPILECIHRGHAVVWHAESGMIASWGDADAYVLPRSSAKMIQALPLVEDGVLEAFGLGGEALALACASHSSEERHLAVVRPRASAGHREREGLRRQLDRVGDDRRVPHRARRTRSVNGGLQDPTMG